MPNDAYRLLNAISIEMYNNSRKIQNSYKEQALYAGYQMALDDLFSCLKRLTSQVEEEERRINAPPNISPPFPATIPYTNPAPYKTINEPYTTTPTWEPYTWTCAGTTSTTTEKETPNE